MQSTIYQLIYFHCYVTASFNSFDTLTFSSPRLLLQFGLSMKTKYKQLKTGAFARQTRVGKLMFSRNKLPQTLS